MEVDGYSGTWPYKATIGISYPCNDACMGEFFVFMDYLAAIKSFFGFAFTSVGLFGFQVTFFGFAVRGLIGFVS